MAASRSRVACWPRSRLPKSRSAAAISSGRLVCARSARRSDELSHTATKGELDRHLTLGRHTRTGSDPGFIPGHACGGMIWRRFARRRALCDRIPDLLPGERTSTDVEGEGSELV